MSFFDSENEDYWIPLADIMTGLALVFILIATSYIVKINQEKKQIIVKYNQSNIRTVHNLDIKKNIYNQLVNEFKNDLPKWQANIESKNLVFSFNNEAVLFDTGKANIKPAFKDILQDFFPRYLKALTTNVYNNEISEIRINGFASKVWNNKSDSNIAFFKNMELSWQRAFIVLNYVYYQLPSSKNQESYLREHFTANGFSSSNSILDANGIENSSQSQRVEFEVLLRDDKI